MGTIGIIGLGVVGGAIQQAFQDNHLINVYDINGRGNFSDAASSDYIFICVPTNSTEEGDLDVSIVNGVCNDLMMSESEGIVIVKSTLQKGTMTSLESTHPSLKFVYMPEFLRDRDAVEWFANPDRIVISGTKPVVDLVLDLFDWVPESTPKLVMTHEEAEVAKLAHNAFIATKVTFTSEIERICKQLDLDPFTVMQVVWTDRRLSGSDHLVPMSRGFGGKCVPKDTVALRKLDGHHDDLSLLAQVLKLGMETNLQEQGDGSG